MIELPFIIELLFITQLSFTIELSPMKNEYANFPAFGRDFKKKHCFSDDLSFAIELPFIVELPFIIELSFIIELPFIIQLSCAIELSPMKNEYANFPAFGLDFKKTSLLF